MHEERKFIIAARKAGYLVHVLRDADWPRLVVMVPGGEVVFLDFATAQHPALEWMGRAVFHVRTAKRALKLLE